MSTATATRPQAPASAPTAWASARPGRGVARVAVDLAVLGLALTLALSPLFDVYGGQQPIPALVAGALAGAGVALVSAARRWTGIGTLAVLVVATFLVAGPFVAPTQLLAGVVPTPAALTAVARAAVATWKDIVTLQPPLGTGGSVLMAPLLLALAGAAVSLLATLRCRRPAVAAAAALVAPTVLVGSILLGTRTPPLPPVVTGTALVVLLVGWASWRAEVLRVRRVVSGLLVAALAVAAGVAAPGALLGDRHRFVVRDVITPPFDLEDYPSPLAAFRSYVQADDAVLFTVSGLPSGARIRLATFDRYDGTVWNVAGNGAAAGSGEFRRVGQVIDTSTQGVPATVGVRIEGLTGVWLPTVGSATSVHLPAATSGQLRFNDASGAAVLTGGVSNGLEYTLDVVVPTVPDEAQLADTPASSVVLPEDTGVPGGVASRATSVAQEAGRPAEVAADLAAWLAETGYFSHGLTQNGDYPSLPGHGAARLATLLDQTPMVGDDEQYAALMALMARSLGLPARVVLGFVPGAGSEASAAQDTPTDEATADGSADAATAPVDVHGSDVRAWVEIAFAGYGWIPFDPTPPSSRTPDDEQAQSLADPQPQVVQPPDTPQDAQREPRDTSAQPSADERADEDTAWPLWARILVWTGIGLAAVAVLLTPILVVLGLKAGRRHRRRRARTNAAAVAGAWQEVLDAATDLDRPARPRATRREAAAQLTTRFAQPAGEIDVGPGLRRLAEGADRADFAPGAPTRAQVAEFWAESDALVRRLRGSFPWADRTRSRVSLRSLRRPRRRGQSRRVASS